MIWLVLEGVLALSLFVFIIWWTLPRKPKDGTTSDSKSSATETNDGEEHKEH